MHWWPLSLGFQYATTTAAAGGHAEAAGLCQGENKTHLRRAGCRSSISVLHTLLPSQELLAGGAAGGLAKTWVAPVLVSAGMALASIGAAYVGCLFLSLIASNAAAVAASSAPVSGGFELAADALSAAAAGTGPLWWLMPASAGCLLALLQEHLEAQGAPRPEGVGPGERILQRL